MSTEELTANQLRELTLLLTQKQAELGSQLEHNRENADPVILDQQSVAFKTRYRTGYAGSAIGRAGIAHGCDPATANERG